jgi:hypothetical protein
MTLLVPVHRNRGILTSLMYMCVRIVWKMDFHIISNYDLKYFHSRDFETKIQRERIPCACMIASEYRSICRTIRPQLLRANCTCRPLYSYFSDIRII